MSIEVKILPTTGDRVDVLATVKGSGETEYVFPLSITRTLQSIWGIQEDDLNEALCGLVYKMFSSIVGTASSPPKGGYWFDSFNSESTIKATLDRMRGLGQEPFMKDSSEAGFISKTFGGGILSEIERVSGLFFEKTSMRLVNALDYSFERAEAENDLSTAPKDNADFLYRVCILSVIIDGFGVRRAGESSKILSLKALENWLAEIFGGQEARKATESFARVKDLRKQYPIHEHFEQDSAGQKVIREEVRVAEGYFGFEEQMDYPTKWKKVTDSFKAAIKNIESIITNYESS